MLSHIRLLSRCGLLSLIFGLAACQPTPPPGGGAGQPEAAATTVKVRLLLYSGRPDPVYFLRQRDGVEQAQALVSRARAVRFDGNTVIASILGYKGILVENPDHVAGLPERFAVHKGTIEVMDRQKAFYADDGRRLEKFLLQEAGRQRVVDDAMLKTLQVDQMK